MLWLTIGATAFALTVLAAAIVVRATQEGSPPRRRFRPADGDGGRPLKRHRPCDRPDYNPFLSLSAPMPTIRLPRLPIGDLPS